MTFVAFLATLALAASQDAVARWTFDGEVKDVGPAALPTTAAGRLEYIDSPLSGKLAVLNGVDTVFQVDPKDKLGVGSGDFTISLWLFPLDRKGGTILARKGWSLALDAGGFKVTTDGGTIAAPIGAAPFAQWNHVVVSIKRGAEGKLSRILVNGEPVGSGDVAPGDWDPPQEPLKMGSPTLVGLLEDVRLYARALDAAEAAALTDQGLPWIRSKAHAKTPFPGKFELLQNDVVVFAGGENARVGQDLGYLETLLSIHGAGRGVRFRSMAWEGDTVYEQLRPLNFGTWTDQFRRAGASVIVAQFGQVEALEGKAGVERFEPAYEALLAQFALTTKRIVLVSPMPFGKELAARNEDLKLYVEAIRRIAAKNGYLFVDLSTAPGGEGLTRNGLHLTAAGHWIAAKETARQLEVPGLSDLDAPDAAGAFRRPPAEAIRSAIREKNRLWSDGWRPTNWAFLNGDRMEQPSSRDHQDRRIRWFPVEIQQYPALIRRQEEAIEKLLEKK
jgi:hypothetical protein